MIRNFLRQLKTGIKNLVSEILSIFKSPLQYINKLVTPKQKEIEYPADWGNLNDTTTEEPIIPSIPIAVEPIIVFEEPIKPGFKLKTPSWFLKLKRILAIIMFVVCCVASINLVTTFPGGLVFIIPTAIINLDYLLKTSSKATGVCWYMLPDIEEKNKK